MSTEYNFFGLDAEGSDSSDSQKICWKTKYCQLLHEYEELLCCFHCHVQNMNSTMKEEEEAEEEEKPSIIELLKQKNRHLVNTIMGLQREIKYKVPMGPPLHPVHDMSLNAPRVLHIYSHPAYLHKHHRPHPHPHPHPHPYPYPYHHRDISMNMPHHIYPHPIPIPHHPKPRPIMPQNAHIPPPIITHPTKPTTIKPLSKDILPYLYPYGGYPYGYPYGYDYPYYSSYYPYYRGLEDRDVDLPTAHPPGGVKKPRPPPHPPLHPVQGTY